MMTKQQISLRRILGVVTFIAVGCAILSHEYSTRQHEKRIAKTLAEAGINVSWTRHRVVRVSTPLDNSISQLPPSVIDAIAQLSCLKSAYFCETDFDDDDLRQIANCSTVTDLNLGATKITNRGMSYLRYFRSLQRLNLYGANVDDVGMAMIPVSDLVELSAGNLAISRAIKRISDAKKLEKLWLPGVDLTDDDIHALSCLTNLSDLWIGGEGITDNGVRHLVRLTKLKCLRVTNAGISDQSVQVFEKLPNLQTLSVSNTLITEKGLISIASIPTVENLSALGISISRDSERPLRASTKILNVDQTTKNDKT